MLIGSVHLGSALFLALHAVDAAVPPSSFHILQPDDFKPLILNVSIPAYDNGTAVIGIPAEEHYTWAIQNTPFFECDDEDITKAYYFRWYSYHNQIDYENHVVTEFYPAVPWAEKFNTIPCAAGHHINEGRWLRDESVVDGYLRFWFSGQANPESYTFWAAHSTWATYRVTGNATLLQVSARALSLAQSPATELNAERNAPPLCMHPFSNHSLKQLSQTNLSAHTRIHTQDLYPKLVENYRSFYSQYFSAQYGCLWHYSDREGQENSVGGDGCRPVSNSVMYGEANALAMMSAAVGNATAATAFEKEALFWRGVVTQKLWSEELGFFVTLTVPQPPPPPRGSGTPLPATSASPRKGVEMPLADGGAGAGGRNGSGAAAERSAPGWLRATSDQDAEASDGSKGSEWVSDGVGVGEVEVEVAVIEATEAPPPPAPPAPSPGADCPSKGQPRWPVGHQVTVREIQGFTPWSVHSAQCNNQQGSRMPCRERRCAMRAVQ
jgi:hypothetical protein